MKRESLHTLVSFVAAAAVFVTSAMISGCASSTDSGGGSPSGSGAKDPFGLPTGDDTDTGSDTADTGGSETGSGGATPGPSSDEAEQACVDTINAYRKTVGLPALARWTSAEACTDEQAKSDSQSGKAHGAFGKCQEMAQNECPGWGGALGKVTKDCLASMWAEGPGGGHYENMKGAKYTKVACGYFTTSKGKVWAIQNFR